MHLTYDIESGAREPQSRLHLRILEVIELASQNKPPESVVKVILRFPGFCCFNRLEELPPGPLGCPGLRRHNDDQSLDQAGRSYWTFEFLYLSRSPDPKIFLLFEIPGSSEHHYMGWQRSED